MFRPSAILLPLLLALAPQAQGAFITDKLLVGLYGNLDNSSKPIKILSSGTSVEVLERQRGYIKVKLNDGSVGWVELRYVTDDTPSQAKLAELEKQNKQIQQNLDKAKEEFDALKKKTEGMDKLMAGNKALEERLEESAKRVAALEDQVKQKDERIKTLGEEQYAGEGEPELQAKIQELEAKLLQSQVKLARRTSMKEDAVYAENDVLRDRMGKASALLKIDDKPLPKEDPKEESKAEGLPVWVYLMLFLTLLTGIVAGFALFDLRSRRLHGGLGA
ncbi:MAG: TIGR04211 family SH3 domain-containing protein [Gammaproteobacteria bacterium]|nr:TIGR04211 family SH3 domain-containing protein [Gammaproteobacteria bacterium]MBU1653441.1 TIGR04211 family SH3 domain-containing protein [Gammaproteobacteria bacterium]MBU1959746.1 TIGR04211 family SH3 domain-containing protein [Gammaproteobacteria bacterium]